MECDTKMNTGRATKCFNFSRTLKLEIVGF